MQIEKLFSNKVPVLLVGPPGVGKTAIVRGAFDYSEIVLSSTMVEEDIAGIPYRDGEYDKRTIPAMFRRIREADAEGKTTALFLDELDKARRSVADTLLTLIASRSVGDVKLPDRTCIIAAANPPEYGGGDGISDAMISRFSTIEFLPSVANWCKWADSTFSSVKSHRIINGVRRGEIPLIDVCGEGLSKKISSPRTIALALSFMDDNPDEESVKMICSGLLTPNVAEKVTHYAFNNEEGIVDTCVKVRVKATKQVRPIEL